MNTAELKATAANLQRTAPHSAEAKAAQQAYQAALDSETAAQNAAAYRAAQAARAAESQRLDFSRTSPRLEATISLGVFPDFSTTDGYGSQEERWAKKIGQSVMLGYVCHDVDDGSKLHGSPDQFPCQILSLRRGAYVSDSTRGRSGWHLLATVRLAPELQLATELEKE